MTFRASKLRVQIPCGGSGSLLGVDGGCGDSPQSALCPDPKPPPPPPPPPCGVPSHFFGAEPWRDWWDTTMVFPRVEDRFVLDAEDLPMLRQQLELKLKLLDLAEQASSVARRRAEAHLADIGIVEQKLQKDGGG